MTKHLHGRDAIRQAALDIFYERGYQGTSVRDIAGRAALSVAGLYHHFSSKEALLLSIVNPFIDELLVVIEAAYDEARPTPQDRLREIVRAHVLFHIKHKKKAFVRYAELGGLSQSSQARVLAAHAREHHLVEDIISAGIRQDVFFVDNVELATRSLLQMCTAVFSWYEEGGELLPDEVATIYADLASDLVRGRRETK